MDCDVSAGSRHSKEVEKQIKSIVVGGPRNWRSGVVKAIDGQRLAALIGCFCKTISGRAPHLKWYIQTI
jgi:hypothetical protein